MKLNLKKLTAIMATGLLTACMLTTGAITDSYITETVSVSAEETIPAGYTPVYTFEDLYAVRNNLDGNYILMNDIDMTELTAPNGEWDINGTGWEPIGTEDNCFSGVFDGNGHKIIGMNIHGNVQYKYVGLFGYISGAEIKNIGMVDCNIDVSGDADYIGSIVGCSANSDICKCFSSGEIITDKIASVGGIIGYGYNNSTIDCYNTSNINTENVIYESNTNNGVIMVYLTHGVGGVIGYNYGNCSNCYNIGNITYSSSTKASVNAICGYNSGSYSNNYYLNGTCEGQQSVSGKCAGLSVAQMKSQSAFTNWDFENVWVIDSTSGYKYPQLRSCMQVPVTEMTITSAPTKTTYVQGETLSLTGGKVSVYHESDDSKGEIDITESMIGAYDMNLIGKQSVPVKYINCSTAFDIIVNPMAVTNLMIDSVSENSVSLSWDKVKGVNEYIIYGYNIAEDIWTELGRTAKTNYTDSTVDLSTEYKYAVSACLSSSEDEFISEKSIVEKPIDMSEVQVNIDDILLADIIASETGNIVVAPEVYYEGKLLVEGTDYNITDGDFQVCDVGEYKLVISGIGRFTGDITTEFTVKCEHNYGEENGIQCLVCLEYKYSLGDANCDSKVDFDDADYMAQTIVSGEIDTLPDSSDFNQDGYIDIMDAYLISCHVKGIEPEGFYCVPELSLNLMPSCAGEETSLSVWVNDYYGDGEVCVTAFDCIVEIEDWIEIVDEKNVINPLTNFKDMTVYQYIEGNTIRFTGFVHKGYLSNYTSFGVFTLDVPEDLEPSDYYSVGEITEALLCNGESVIEECYISYGGGIQVVAPVEPGDANQDGIVNVRDCAFIASALARGVVYEISLSVDYNGDGKINVRDAAAIASALAG